MCHLYTRILLPGILIGAVYHAMNSVIGFRIQIKITLNISESRKLTDSLRVGIITDV